MSSITLDRADYFELKSLALAAELQLQAVMTAATAYEAAKKALRDKASGHGVEQGQPFRLIDDTYEVVVGEANGTQA